MREIKVRCWNGKAMDYDCRDLTVLNGQLVPEGDNILMLSTGLRDRHGKEIFESDWLRIIDVNSTQPQKLGLVEFQDGAFCITVPFQDWRAFYCTLAALAAPKYGDGCEILGSIYESPHLFLLEAQPTPQEVP